MKKFNLSFALLLALVIPAWAIGPISGGGQDLSGYAPLASPTFTGTVVLPNSQALVTPVLGTPTSVTLTNATGLPISTGVSGLGTGIATALTVNTGSAGAPVLFNGASGTPTSLTLTNATGLPISTGVSGLGTGIATALAVNTGSAGAPVLFNGASGTPTSLTLTNATGLPAAGVTGTAAVLGANTFTAAQTNSTAGAASVPAHIFTGTWLTGGTGTTNFPHLLLQATGTTASTTWQTLGTGLGINAVTGFSGNLFDFQIAGSSKFKSNNAGDLTITGNVTFNGLLKPPQTITAGGTTGAQTINKAAGTVNFAAAATSLVVTDSLVTTSSTVYCAIRTNDSTALLKNVVPASGSFTITLNAAATAETSVGFFVVN